MLPRNEIGYASDTYEISDAHDIIAWAIANRGPRRGRVPPGADRTFTLYAIQEAEQGLGLIRLAGVDRLGQTDAEPGTRSRHERRPDSRPELRKRDRVGWERQDLLPAASREVDQQHLVDVEAPAVVALARRAVEGDGAVVVC